MSRGKREITEEQLTEAQDNLFAAAVWQPGQSGNPAGRPKEPDDLIELLRVVIGKQGMKGIYQNLKFLANPPEDSKVPYHVQLGAISEILDRLVGKPRQAAPEEGGVPFLAQLVMNFFEENGNIKPEGRSLRAGRADNTIDAPSVREDAGEGSWTELPG